MTKRLVLRLPPPHARQREIEECTAKRIVIRAGRRGGKTTLAARVAIKLAGAGRRVLYTTPIADQTDAFWQKCNDWLAMAVAARLINKNETRRLLDFRHGEGRIAARTAFKPDHLRGDYGDLIIFDEFAYQDPAVWEKVGAPMLLDNDGDAWFMGTPNRRNHFYTLNLKAEANEDGRWAAFSFPSTDNPFLSAEALAELSKDMTDEDYQQEILAVFLPGEGAVFSVGPDNFWTPARCEHPKLMAIDWGHYPDYTSISIGCPICRNEQDLTRLRGHYPTQWEAIETLWLDWGKPGVWAEGNGVGLANLQALQAAGLPVNSFWMGSDPSGGGRSGSKSQIIQGLKLALEKKTWRFVKHDVAQRELESYEMKQSSRTGALQYSAPDGMHDDTVISRGLLVWAAGQGAFTLA